MIISRTPFRISFFGGGTDYPKYFNEHGGAVLGTTIDKYCYIMVRELPDTFTNKYRIVYKDEEFVDDVKDIRHPAIRECIKYLDITRGLEVIHWSDLPARKGMGSSSAFVVGLINALRTLKDKSFCFPFTIAEWAVYFEQGCSWENVGVQDSYFASLGGFKHFTFSQGKWDSSHISSAVRWNCTSISHGELGKYLMLFDTGTSRIASKIAGELIKDIPSRTQELGAMVGLVNSGLLCLKENRMLDFGRLLHEAWMLKRELSKNISNPEIDNIYDKAREAGAIGGKLLGAGGGGFMLFFVEPEKQGGVKKALGGLKYVPFEFESTGSQIIYDGSP